MTCARQHPEFPDAACGLPTETHPNHVAFRLVTTETGGLVTQRAIWPNDEYVSKAQQRQQSTQVREKVSQLAEEARAAQPAPVESPPPQEGDLKPLRAKSAQGRVAQFFLDHVGEWIPGRRFTNPNDINGGSEGLRRVRVLQDEYLWPIERRKDPDPNTFVEQYRLIHRPHQNAEIT